MLYQPGSQLVFDEYFQGTNVLRTDSEFNDWLGRANDLKLFLVADRTSAGGATLTVSVQETTDEEVQWFDNSGGPAIFQALSGTDNTVAKGFDTEASRGRPGLGLRRLNVVIETGVVRVRIWAAARSGYRRFHKRMFKERLQGTTPLYSAHQSCGLLGSVDKLAVSIYPEEVSTAPVTLTVQMEESPNGTAWRSTGLPVFSGTITSAAMQTISLSNSIPASRFVRFKLQLGAATDGASVRVWVTGRDTRAP